MLFDSLEARYRLLASRCFSCRFRFPAYRRGPLRLDINETSEREGKSPSLTTGILVPVSFAVTGFTLPAYQRRLLRRPYK